MVNAALVVTRNPDGPASGVLDGSAGAELSEDLVGSSVEGESGCHRQRVVGSTDSKASIVVLRSI